MGLASSCFWNFVTSADGAWGFFLGLWSPGGFCTLVFPQSIQGTSGHTHKLLLHLGLRCDPPWSWGGGSKHWFFLGKKRDKWTAISFPFTQPNFSAVIHSTSNLFLPLCLHASCSSFLRSLSYEFQIQLILQGFCHLHSKGITVSCTFRGSLHPVLYVCSLRHTCVLLLILPPYFIFLTLVKVILSYLHKVPINTPGQLFRYV